MTMRSTVGAVAALVLGLLGCASGGQEPEGGLRAVTETEAGASNGREGQHMIYANADVGVANIVPASLDSAYNAIALAYQSLGIQLKDNEPAVHTLGNRKLVLMRTFLGSRLSAFFECGNDPATGVPRADSYQLVISVISTLRATDAQDTRVNTLATAQANDLATSASSVYCPSTGKFERALLRAAGYQPN